MKTVKEYYASLSKKERSAVVKKSLEVYLDGDGHEGDSCTSCTPTTAYGGCYIVNGACTWVPEFGR